MDLLVLGLLQKILSGSGNTVIDVIIDAILSETSENPVQNKVVTKALKNKADISHKHTAVEVGADSIGSAETALNDAKKYTDGKIADIINGAPSTLDTLSEIATAMDENKSVVDALDKAIGTKANKADIPTKISELENDSNFLTEHQDLSSYAKTEDIPTELPANGGNADTVNNHTVNTDVPSDAVFTDTVYTLPIATTEILGGVMPDGTTITVDGNGVISSSKASAGSKVKPVYFNNGKPVACTYTLGKSVPRDAVFTDTVYTLPIATTSVLGGVKVDGTTIAVDSNGVISTTGGLTVDTLLDMTTSSSALGGTSKKISLSGNIPNYKFLYIMNGTVTRSTTGEYDTTLKSDMERKMLLPTSVLEWGTWETTRFGIFMTYCNPNISVYYYSTNELYFVRSTTTGDKTLHIIVLGIK